MNETPVTAIVEERKRIAVFIALGVAALLLLLALRPAKRPRDEHGLAGEPAAAAAPPRLGHATAPLSEEEWKRIAAVLPANRIGAAPDGSHAGSGASPSSPSTWDPFRAFPGRSDAGEISDGTPPTAPDLFRLEGVSLDAAGSRKHAILNDRVVRIGDEVGGHRVVEIERGEIVLESGGRRTAISIRTEKSD